jgi:phospholipid/cholesterol/gamma-HCH transport system substrate-binding protein
MQSRALELLVGLFFSLGVAAIFILTFRVASLESAGADEGYRVTADFENIGGLRSGASVTIAGVRIGRVREIVIDPTTFNARATLEIGKEYGNIPADSSAKILTAGVLGEKYIGLEPGADEAVLKDGGRIAHTQSAVVLENIIGQFLANKATGSTDSKKE